MHILLRLFQQILSLRYHVTIKWEKHLQKGTTLVLPNHVALVDPQIVMAFLWTKVRLDPVVQSSFYNAPVLHWIFKRLGAIPITNHAKDEALKTEVVQWAFVAIKDALHNGKNVLLYPAWGLKTQATEVILGKKSAFEVAKHMPEDTHVVVVTIRWLRWSSSSKAWMWDTPSLVWFMVKWLWYILANGIIGVPKRSVDIEIIDVTHDAHKKASWTLEDFNHRLEHLYNKRWPESLEYLQHYRFYNDVEGKELPSHIAWSLELLQFTADYSRLQYKPEILDSIIKQIRQIKPAFTDDITLKTNLVLDVYFDSLDTAELKSFVQLTYPESSNPPLLDLKVVGDYVVMAMGQSPHVDVLKPCHWNYPETDVSLREVVGSFTETDTIPWLMKVIFNRHKKYSFCYDNVFGVQSRKDYAIKAYLIANILKKYDWDHIGIMLPALTWTSLLITATYLAWKVPVMLNWTQWELAFDHCAGYKKIPWILTSKKFFAKIKAPHYEKYNLIFLEEMLKNLSLGQKLKAVWDAIMFKIPKQTEEAVILFTSWSEALPKAVSITHQNVIQNIKWALQLLAVEKDDILLWFLPPFHSFGFTVNTILPLITWLRVAYSPDPNDAKTLANLIEHTKITWVASTPTFLKRILSSATQEQLASLRFVITGAEKCPKAVFDQVATMTPQAKIIEWYGITECSPIISANPIDKIKPGTVGLPIVWLDLVILDIDHQQPVKTWQEWMIYVSWPSVFGGYIDKAIESPFLHYLGKKYYKTGDLWYVDTDWYLTVTGRLKRFIKISGEMISLPFVEGVLLEKFGKKDEINLAIEAKEHSNWTATIVAFTTDGALHVDDLNGYLRKKWVSNLIHINEVRKVNIIPILWSWKTDYKILKAMIV